jgi:hypothetical protein
MTDDKIKFQSGSLVATLGALQVATYDQITVLLAGHLAGDRGEIDADAKATGRALTQGERLLSGSTIGPRGRRSCGPVGIDSLGDRGASPERILTDLGDSHACRNRPWAA